MPEREGRRVVTGGKGDDTHRTRDQGQGNGRGDRENATEGERRRAVGPGSAPLRSFFSLAQRLTGIFCRPNRGDVKIALMVDQREKPCSDRYLSLSRLRCVPLRSRLPPSSPPLIDASAPGRSADPLVTPSCMIPGCGSEDSSSAPRRPSHGGVSSDTATASDVSRGARENALPRSSLFLLLFSSVGLVADVIVG